MQPRPVIAVADGRSADKVHFRIGDLWIKHNTGLKNVVKEDLDRMYAPVIENEATKRARIVLEHLRQDSGLNIQSNQVDAIPTEDLLLGSRVKLRRFVEAKLSTKDALQFSMLVEMARNTLVHRWSAWNKGTFYGSEVSNEKQEYLAHYSAEYMPVLQSVIDIGLTVIAYRGPMDWFARVLDVLTEAFEVSGQLGRLVGFRDAEDRGIHYRAVTQAEDQSYDSPPLAIGRPAYELYIGARVLATYATMRRFSEYLGAVLARFARTVTEDRHRHTKTPLLFWPFAGDLGLPQMPNGRNQTLWEERIAQSWPDVSGSKEIFMEAAAGLELIL